MKNNDAVEKLQKFKNLISDYFDGKYNDERSIKTEINYLLPMAQAFVMQAGCLKMMTMAPPPAIGGMVIQNFNPFDMIFHDFWGTSIIPEIINMVEQSIGKYENNLVDTTPRKKTNIEYRNAYPEKVTLKWLFDHAPIRFWLTGISILIASFLAGYKLSPFIDQLLKVIER